MGDKMNRYKDFAPLDDPNFIEDGKRLYLAMRQKYPNKNDEDLDKILNGLCAAMYCLMYANVPKEKHSDFLDLIYTIIKQNIPVE